MFLAQRFGREKVSLLDVIWPRRNQRERPLLGKNFQLYNNVVCYTAVFSVVTQLSSPGALRDDTKNGCVADYITMVLMDHEGC